MWLEIGLIVLIVIIIVATIAYFTLSEDTAPLPPLPAPDAPAQVPVDVPVTAPPAPIRTLSPASTPTPSPTITPTPVVTTVTASSGLPSGIVNGNNIRNITSRAVYKIENNKRRHYPNSTVYASWGRPPAINYDASIVNSIPLGTPMPLKETAPATTTTTTTTTTTAPAPAVTYTSRYRPISLADITPGVDQWALYGKTVEDCAKKCATTAGCVGFSRVGNDCWGKTSGVVNTGKATIYFDKSKTTSGNREGAGTSAGTTTQLPTVRPTLYKDDNYGGASWTVPGLGNRPLTGSGIRNEVSSIRIPAGWKLTVYDKVDCSGTNKVYTGNVSTLKGSGLNNDIACVNLAYR